jgi:hypothetical protein
MDTAMTILVQIASPGKVRRVRNDNEQTKLLHSSMSRAKSLHSNQAGRVQVTAGLARHPLFL